MQSEGRKINPLKFFEDNRKIFLAYHEAGHAVMHYLLKRKFTHITLRKNKRKRSLGHVRYKVININEDHIRYYEFLEREISISLGGVAAEILLASYQDHSKELPIALIDLIWFNHCCTYDFNSGSHEKGVDAYNAHQLSLKYTHDDEDSAQELRNKCRKNAENLLFSNWNAVEALAKELLLRNKKIKYMEARKIIKEALGEKERNP